MVRDGRLVLRYVWDSRRTIRPACGGFLCQAMMVIQRGPESSDQIIIFSVCPIFFSRVCMYTLVPLSLLGGDVHSAVGVSKGSHVKDMLVEPAPVDRWWGRASRRQLLCGQRSPRFPETTALLLPKRMLHEETRSGMQRVCLHPPYLSDKHEVKRIQDSLVEVHEKT